MCFVIINKISPLILSSKTSMMLGKNVKIIKHVKNIQIILIFDKERPDFSGKSPDFMIQRL